MIATLHILADATAATGGSMDAAGIGIIITAVISALLGGGAGSAITRKITLGNNPLHCRKVEDYVTRDEHRRDVNHIHALIRDSEKSIHGRMDKQSEQLNQLHGLVTATNRQIDNIAKKL